MERSGLDKLLVKLRKIRRNISGSLVLVDCAVCISNGTVALMLLCLQNLDILNIRCYANCDTNITDFD